MARMTRNEVLDLLQKHMITWPYSEGLCAPGGKEYRDSGWYWMPIGRHAVLVAWGGVDSQISGVDWMYHKQGDPNAHESVRSERAVEWDGAGLPTVGAVVEFRDHGVGGPVAAHIVAHHVNGKEAIWSEYADDGALSYGSVGEFRPIRTDREKAVEEMLSMLTGVMDDSCREGGELLTNYALAEAIYDAGYRKTEGA